MREQLHDSKLAMVKLGGPLVIRRRDCAHELCGVRARDASTAGGRVPNRGLQKIAPSAKIRSEREPRPTDLVHVPER